MSPKPFCLKASTKMIYSQNLPTRRGRCRTELKSTISQSKIPRRFLSKVRLKAKSLIQLAPAAVLQLPIRDGEKGLFDIIKEKLKELGNQKHIGEYDDFFRRYFDFSGLPYQTDESLAKLQNEFVIHYQRADQQVTNKNIDEIEAGSTGGMSVYATYLSMGMEHDYSSAIRQRLKDSTFPVSIVHGTKDLNPPSSSRRYVDIFPSANVKWFELEDSHFLHANPLVAEIVKATFS